MQEFIDDKTAEILVVAVLYSPGDETTYLVEVHAKTAGSTLLAHGSFA